MKYPFPIRIPVGKVLTISQGFVPDAHEGNDVVCGDGPSTFGLPVVWPFPFPGKIYDSIVDSPIAAETKRAHVQVDGVDPVTNISYSLLCIHISGAIYKVEPGQDSSVRLNQGDTIAFIGNGGQVSPKPTVERPFDGSHAHIGLGIKKPGELNYKMVDPSLYFDILNPFRGPDDPSRDTPVYEWAKRMQSPEVLPSEKLRLLGEQMMATNPKQASIVLAVARVLKAFGS